MYALLPNHIRVLNDMTAVLANQMREFWQKGREKGVSVGLGCRRGGSHSKATAVVYISVLISPEKSEITPSSQTIWRTLPLSFFFKFFSVELVAGLWNDGVCREFELARR